MRAVVTRVKEASVVIEGNVTGKIGQGFLILLGIGPEDTEAIADKMAEKICNCRVFEDENGKMNLSLDQVGGSLLVISQFTLYADLKKRRPGFSHAAKPELAVPLYERFMETCRARGFAVEHGEFAADMQVYSVNDGPVHLIRKRKPASVRQADAGLQLQGSSVALFMPFLHFCFLQIPRRWFRRVLSGVSGTAVSHRE